MVTKIIFPFSLSQVRTTMNWDDVGFVLASNYRKKVIKALKKFPKTPKLISEITNIRIVHVSRTIKELTERGLVECLTPNRVKGKLFQLTEKGRDLLKFI
ncbi:MAG: winged helix DNA-binding protein [Promethearchaeota archaeon]